MSDQNWVVTMATEDLSKAMAFYNDGPRSVRGLDSALDRAESHQGPEVRR
jgi:hypothetical protein